jgi:putative endonuclease
MFTVYVLYSPNYNKIYIGYSSDVETRFKFHNELAWKGWTINFRPWIIAHLEDFETKAEAMKREKQLKSSAGRRFIWNEIIPKLK